MNDLRRLFYRVTLAQFALLTIPPALLYLLYPWVIVTFGPFFDSASPRGSGWVVRTLSPWFCSPRGSVYLAVGFVALVLLAVYVVWDVRFDHALMRIYAPDVPKRRMMIPGTGRVWFLLAKTPSGIWFPVAFLLFLPLALWACLEREVLLMFLALYVWFGSSWWMRRRGIRQVTGEEVGRPSAIWTVAMVMLTLLIPVRWGVRWYLEREIGEIGRELVRETGNPRDAAGWLEIYGGKGRDAVGLVQEIQEKLKGAAAGELFVSRRVKAFPEKSAQRDAARFAREYAAGLTLLNELLELPDPRLVGPEQVGSGGLQPGMDLWLPSRIQALRFRAAVLNSDWQEAERIWRRWGNWSRMLPGLGLVSGGMEWLSTESKRIDALEWAMNRRVVPEPFLRSIQQEFSKSDAELGSVRRRVVAGERGLLAVRGPAAWIVASEWGVPRLFPEWESAVERREQARDWDSLLEGRPGADCAGQGISEPCRTFCRMAQNLPVRYRAAQLGIAAELFRRKFGQFPLAAEHLVPEFLDMVPEDPSGGGTMQLRRGSWKAYLFDMTAHPPVSRAEEVRGLLIDAPGASGGDPACGFLLDEH